MRLLKMVFIVGMHIAYISSGFCLEPTTNTFQGTGESYNLNQTIEYINLNLSKNIYEETDSWHYSKYNFSLKIDNNLLVITEVHNNNNQTTGPRKTITEYSAPIDKISANFGRALFADCAPCTAVSTGFVIYLEKYEEQFSLNSITYNATGNMTGRNSSTEDGVTIRFSNKNRVGESLCNAFTHLSELGKSESKNNISTSIDPFATNKSSHSPLNNSESSFNNSSNAVIQMTKNKGDIYEIPVEINGVLKISFIFDSGASDVSISPDVALTLIRTGTVSETDFVGKQEYKFADGSSATSKVFLIRELKIGKKIIKNVRASISNSLEAPMLLGQSVLQQIGKFSIDNYNHTLTIE